MVNFVIRQDKKRIFRFAPLQSPPAQAALKEYSLPQENYDSFVFISAGIAYLHSTAALKVMSLLPWYWQWTKIFWLVPRFIRDAAYRYVARNRYRWFGQKETCMVPEASVRNRFL